MQRIIRAKRACLIQATVLMFAQASASHVSAEENDMSQQVVMLKQEMFTLSTQHDPQRLEQIRIESVDGMTTNVNQLPPKARECVLRMEARVIPQLEFVAVDPRKVIRLIAGKPKPKSAMRLGLVVEDKECEADPLWLRDVSFGGHMLSCSVTNVSFLNFSLVFADAFDCEFGVTQDGEPVFRNKTAEAKTKHRIYALKSEQVNVSINNFGEKNLQRQ